jgi:hypothetical protein
MSRKTGETWGTPFGPEIAQDGSLAFIMRRTVQKLLCACTLLLLAGCATIAPPKPPSLELPKPPSDLRAVRKGDKVILTWTIPARTTDHQTIRSLGPTRICRGVEAKLAECGTPVGVTAATKPSGAESSAKSSAHTSTHLSAHTSAQSPSHRATAGTYTDTLPAALESDDPSASITYAIEVLNTEERGGGVSSQVRVPLLRTVAPPELRATVNKDGVALQWRRNVPRIDASSPVRYVYRVYRHSVESEPWSLVGDVPAGGESEITLTDSNIEWGKTYVYRIETASVISREGAEQQIEGDDSPEVKVFADDAFPPAVPSGLQAVFSGPGQQRFIDLIWAPVTDLDLDGYNVYRHEEGGAPVKVNAEIVKAPAYRDANVAPGGKYFYSVSAVDVRGNESARSEEASESVP